ncbi:MAG: hypothetical protein QOC72_3378 [Methylobacteriaceae bacterium]|nr:hypothetical protein [Methylobacteriaceae bacterium]
MAFGDACKFQSAHPTRHSHIGEKNVHRADVMRENMKRLVGIRGSDGIEPSIGENVGRECTHSRFIVDDQDASGQEAAP